MQKPTRDGFTLVELLVVIAIIGVLVALLLPAIQSAREAARRAQCVNNQKQIGVAVQNYHDTYRKLPTGNYSCCNGTWQMLLLPFLEQQTLADLYQFQPKSQQDFFLPQYRYDVEDNSANPPVNNLQVVTNRIPSLTCPSDEPQTDNRGITFHNYAMNYGNTNHIGFDHLTPGNESWVQHLSGVFIGVDFQPRDAVQFEFREITDGLSNTLLAAEVVQGQNGDLRGFTWWGWSAGFETFALPNATDPDTLQNGDSCNPETPNPPCTAPNTAANRFRAAARSRHPGGVNVVMVDSSVQFVLDSVDLQVWRAASSIQGGEVTESAFQ